MQILQDNQLMERLMRKSELMTLWNVESWSEEPYGVYFVSRRWGTNRLENVGPAFKNLILVVPVILKMMYFHYQYESNYMFN